MDNPIFSFVGVWLQKGVEVAHREVVSPSDTHIGDALPVLIERLYRRYHIVQMLPTELATVYGKADHVAKLLLLLRGLEVVLHGVVTQFRNPDAIAPDELHGEALTGEALMVALAVKKLRHVDVDPVAPGGEDHATDAGLVEALGQILTLLDAGLLVVEITSLI